MKFESTNLELAQLADEFDVAEHLALGHGACVEVLVHLDEAVARRHGRGVQLLHLGVVKT